MICKKCGCDTLIKNDDWYKCANCGAIIFDTEVKLGDMESPTKQVESIEKNAAYQKQQYTEQTKETDDVNQETKEKSKLREAIDFCLPIVIAVIIAIILKTSNFESLIFLFILPITYPPFIIHILFLLFRFIIFN